MAQQEYNALAINKKEIIQLILFIRQLLVREVLGNIP